MKIRFTCQNNFRLMITETKIIFMTLLTHFSKTTVPLHIIYSGKLSTIIIFKLCKFSVNSRTLCFFLSYIKYHTLSQGTASFNVIFL